jgi:two-component system nitrate/nitrite response regulator NarL
LSTNTHGSPDANAVTGLADQIRILVVIGVRLYREGLSEILGRHGGFKVIALAADYSAALERCYELQPDVVFLDVTMPDGLRLVHELHIAAPEAAVVATAVAETDGEIVACAEAGVAGFVTRDQSLADAVHILASVAHGESPCSPRTAGALLRRVAVLSAQREPPGPPDGLTARERQIAGLIARGRSNKEIARELYIELSTVKNHVHHLLEKLGVRGRAEVAARVRPASRAEPPSLRDPVPRWIQDASAGSWTRPQADVTMAPRT